MVHMSMVVNLTFQEYIGPLLDAVRTHNRTAALEWKQSGQWATVEQLVMASGAEGLAGGRGADVVGAGPSTQPSAAATSWTCQHCTFINQTASESCDMCHLPK